MLSGPRRVAVIGANGFLGASLVDALLAQGARVNAFDRYSTPPRHRVTPDVTLYQGDLLEPGSLTEVVKGAHDVFHFTTLTGPQDSARDPMRDIATNVTAGVGLFSLCAEADVQRVFFASSGGTVYGTAPMPHTEERARNPISPYGIGKTSLENYLRFFEAQHGLESVSLRISNPYGPGQKPGTQQGIIPIALRAARDGLPLRRFGDGSMTRDYIYAPDLIDMVLRIWDRPKAHTYNLGAGAGTRLGEVLQLVQEVTGRELELEEVAVPMSFVHTSVLDVTRYHAHYGPPRLTPMREGIEATWERIRHE
ncbi:NAD-dependent epimerase/dehydratase family protein [Kineosporia rhizophila]|uniref:NAD-dependent epimerase/dehydratase family protein n=1 Tax=Kineosporia rhizophila TaxID=84633 RepID=UPI001E417BF4|nr:NAD-dependent epimerase/dehydratase family protein [Kineosporia rhizophila]